MTAFFSQLSPELVYGQVAPVYIYPRPTEEIPENPYANFADSSVIIDCNALDSINPCSFDDDPMIKYIPVNVHYIMTSDGRGNFTETGDGAGGTYNGYQRAEDIINAANEQMEENNRVWNSATDIACGIHFRLVLKGVYFHRTNTGLVSSDPVRYSPNGLWTSDYFYANEVNIDSEINCYLFNATVNSGQTNGTICTLHDNWVNYIRLEKPDTSSSSDIAWSIGINARTLLHEIFHGNGLWIHPFETDDCDDTPIISPPCWQRDLGNPNCDEDHELSNNIMDYNSYLDWSLSPCQICRLNTMWKDQYIEQEGGECAPLNSFFDMPSEVCTGLPSSNPSVWLEGSASFNESVYFIEIYEVEAVDSSTIVGAYDSTWFEGQVGLVNLKDYLDYDFECGKIYRVRLGVTNACEDIDEMVRYVSIVCGCDIDPESCCVDALSITPNPGGNYVYINYDLSESKSMTLTIHHQFSGQIGAVVKDQVWTNSGSHSDYCDTSYLPNGMYFARVITDNQVKTVQFYIAR